MADKGLYNLLIDLRASTAQLQQDMDRAVGILQRGSGAMKNVLQGFTVGFAAAIGTEVINQVGRLANALGDLADKGDAAGAIAENFQRLGGAAKSIDEAKRAVLGTVSAFDLMRAANEGMVKGIPQLNQNFAQLAEFSNRFADATGQDTLPVLNQLIAAMGTGAPKALKAFGFELQEGATKAQNQAAVLAQLGEKMEALAPLGESVQQGQERFAAALADATNQVGIAINDNQELASVYNRLAEEIEKIDWRQVGQDVASMVASIASVLPSLQSVTGEIEAIAQTIRNLTGNSTRSDLLNFGGAQLQSEIAALEGELALRQSGVRNNQYIDSMAFRAIDSVLGTEISGEDPNKTAQLQDDLKRKRGELELINKELQKIDEKQKMMSGPLIGPASPSEMGMLFNKDKGVWQNRDDFFGTGKGGGGGADKAAKEIEKIKQKWADLQATLRTNTLKDAIEESIKFGDVSGFDQLKGKLKEQIANAFIEGNKEFLKAGVSSDQLREQAMKMAEAQVKEYEDKMSDALAREYKERQDMAEDLAREEAENRRELMEYYGFGGQDNVFTGLLDQLNSSFGAGGPISSAIAEFTRQLDTTGRYLYESATYLGSTMSADQAHSMGIQGPAMESGAFGTGAETFAAINPYLAAAQYIANTIETFINADRADRGADDNRAWGAAIGTALLGPSFGSQIGSAIGSQIARGAQNRETQARHSFSNWLEDRLSQMGGLTVYDRGNQNPRNLRNFIEGSTSRFNDPGWGDRLNSSENGAAFKGLGLALREIAEISEDVGDQIAAMLFDNLEGNVNNARMLVRKLGLSYAEVEEKLVEIGNRGERTWLEIETGLQGASQAFGDGLVEVGNYAGAMQQLLDSGGRGFEAVQSVRNIAVEAKEAGIKNFAELREFLLKTFDPATVDSFFQSLERRGITSLDQLAGISDRVGGGIVADMDAAGAAFKDTAATLEQSTAEANATLKESIQALRENTAAVRGNKNIPVEDDLDIPEVALASGGVLTGPTRALMGEAGPEAILPLTRRNGKLGVAFHGVEAGMSSGMIFNIDARGAAPGVEHQIRRAMREVEGRVMDRISRSSQHRRGRVN